MVESLVEELLFGIVVHVLHERLEHDCADRRRVCMFFARRYTRYSLEKTEREIADQLSQIEGQLTG